MEKRKIPVVKSEDYYKDIQEVFDYGAEVFGLSAADAFIEELISSKMSISKIRSARSIKL
jgi:plasmid stabilization system protein ParE